jgi:anti-anti-sigma factor
VICGAEEVARVVSFVIADWPTDLGPSKQRFCRAEREIPAPHRRKWKLSTSRLLGTKSTRGNTFPRRQEEFGDRPPTGTMTYSLKISTTARSTSLQIVGDLDYQSTDDFVDVGTRLIARRSDAKDLHLDFSKLSFLDSAALSGLLILHRRASEAGVAFHLDHRPPFLDRLLQVTGLFSHFDLTRTDAETGDPNLLGQNNSNESRSR